MSEYLNRAYLPILNIAGFDGDEQYISRFIRTNIKRFRKCRENEDSLDTDDSNDRASTDVSSKSDEEDGDSINLHVHVHDDPESQIADDASR
jgi:hypothetical protein